MHRMQEEGLQQCEKHRDTGDRHQGFQRDSPKRLRGTASGLLACDFCSADGRFGLGARLRVWKSQGVDRNGKGVRANLIETLLSAL